jgi:hypothetical protein
MVSRINTYTSGFDIFITRDITKGDMVNICNELTDKFDNKYIFEPEPICDGFIYIKNQKYKSMRLSCFHAPWVNRNVMEEWKDNKDIFVKKTTDDKFNGKRKTYSNTRLGANGCNYYSTCLKSFYDAPAWSYDELDTIKDVLENYDIRTTNTKEIKLKNLN